MLYNCNLIYNHVFAPNTKKKYIGIRNIFGEINRMLKVVLMSFAVHCIRKRPCICTQEWAPSTYCNMIWNGKLGRFWKMHIHLRTSYSATSAHCNLLWMKKKEVRNMAALWLHHRKSKNNKCRINVKIDVRWFVCIPAQQWDRVYFSTCICLCVFACVCVRYENVLLIGFGWVFMVWLNLVWFSVTHRGVYRTNSP